MFGPDHLGAVAALAVLGAWLVVQGRRHGPASPWVRRARWALAGILSVNLAVWHVRAVVLGEWAADEGLPLHLCDAAILVTAVALIRPRPLGFEVAYLWCLGGTLQGVITPNILEGFPSYRYFQFFITHGGLVVAAVFLAACCDLKPRRGALWRVALLTNGWAVVAALGNAASGGNYMHLRYPPPTGSLLDYLGPWPWYLLATEVLMIALFALLLLPFRCGGASAGSKIVG
jgi:hypothetical integral membrane protein (TIGR02206 family)